MLLLAPAAPHLAEELWQQTGHPGSVHQQAWPTWIEELARDEMVQVPVEVNGRLRATVDAANDAAQDEIQETALSLPRIQQHLAGKRIKKLIYVPGKVLNIVTADD